VRGDLARLREPVETLGLNWPAGEIVGVFEAEDRGVYDELQAQPTSIDFVIGQIGRPDSIYIEAKFVEQEFGGCSVFERGDCDGSNPIADHNRCYLHTIGRQYWNVMDELEIAAGEIRGGPFCAFANYYQCFREVGFALRQGGQMLFLYDQRNPAFNAANGRGLIPFLFSLLPPSIRERVRHVTIQALVSHLSTTCQHHDWLEQFRPKYGLA